MADATEKLENKPRIVSLDPTSIEDVLDNVREVGRAANVEDAAEQYAQSLDRRIQRVKSIASFAAHRPKVACLEWMEPVMAAGHWMPQMVEMAGGEDCLGNKNEPSFTVEWQKVVDQQPEVIVICPCGFDARRAMQELQLFKDRAGWESLPAVREGKVFVVDASSYFSRSGPRLVDGLEILGEIIHPELFSGMVPTGAAARIWR